VAWESFYDLRLLLRDPTLSHDLWLSISGRPLLDESGELYGGVIVHRDVTEQRQAEAETANARRLALEAASLRNDFLSNISHELLTPLNAVLGMSQLLLDTTLAMRQREYAETIRSSGELLRDIVEDVLDFSHLSEGRFVLEENQFDPHDTLERAAGCSRAGRKSAGFGSRWCSTKACPAG